MMVGTHFSQRLIFCSMVSVQFQNNPCTHAITEIFIRSNSWLFKLMRHLMNEKTRNCNAYTNRFYQNLNIATYLIDICTVGNFRFYDYSTVVYIFI